MNETNLLIIKLIEQNYSLDQISLKLNLSKRQLYVRLKQIINYGYTLSPKYMYNADIHYKIICDDKKPEYDFSISIPKKRQIFNFLAVSDLHVGNENSDLRLMNYVYDYAVKNGINYIFVCGDNIEGDYTTDKKSISNVHDQLKYFIKKYPYDKSVNSVMIFGNHDYHSLRFDGLNPAQTIKNSRYDIIPIGYGQGNVNLKNDSLVLFHKLYEKSYPDLKSEDKIILSGHGHMMKTKLKDQLWLCIPSLSYVSIDKTKEIIPGFVDLSVNFDKGKFECIEAKQIVITPKLITVSETKCRVKSIKG